MNGHMFRRRQVDFKRAFPFRKYSVDDGAFNWSKKARSLTTPSDLLPPVYTEDFCALFIACLLEGRSVVEFSISFSDEYDLFKSTPRGNEADV